jgi:hypothetical protein
VSGMTRADLLALLKDDPGVREAVLSIVDDAMARKAKAALLTIEGAIRRELSGRSAPGTSGTIR